MAVALQELEATLPVVPRPGLDEQEDLRPYRWTRAEFHRIQDESIIDPDARVELIDGIIFWRPYVKPPHATSVIKVARVLDRRFGEGYHVRPQVPFAIGEYSEPLPDLAVVQGEPDDYAAEHPQVAVLVVEISDSSLSRDRVRKAGLYASAGVPEYWVVDLVHRRLEVRRDPKPMGGEPFGYGYAGIRLFEEDGAVAPLALPRKPIRVRDLLPAQRAPEA